MNAARKAGARIEELVGVLASTGSPAAADAAEELLRLLLGLYGDGLGRIMAALGEEGAAGAAIGARLLADPLVESLLLLHDLHPLSADERIQRALEAIRPHLGSHAGGVEYLGVAPDGVARLRLEGACHGCPSSAATARTAIRDAVLDAAPEVADVEVEGTTGSSGPPLLPIGRSPRGPASGLSRSPLAGAAEGGPAPTGPGAGLVCPVPGAVTGGGAVRP